MLWENIFKRCKELVPIGYLQWAYLQWVWPHFFFTAACSKINFTHECVFLASFQQTNEVLLVSYLAAITKGTATASEVSGIAISLEGAL